MANKDHKVNEAILVVYQAPNKETGLTITMEIYDETGAKDIPNFPDVTMTERGSSGIYDGSFTPDVVGDWAVVCHKADGTGSVVKHYSVGNFNVNDLGGGLATVDTKIDTIDGKLDNLQSPPMIG
jgi:hypothetical protein